MRLMQDFGGYSELGRAPARLVHKVLLLYQAEGRHAKVKKWQAQVEADWQKQGLR